MDNDGDNRTKIYIGAGVAAVVVIALLAFLLTRGGGGGGGTPTTVAPTTPPTTNQSSTINLSIGVNDQNPPQEYRMTAAPIVSWNVTAKGSVVVTVTGQGILQPVGGGELNGTRSVCPGTLQQRNGELWCVGVTPKTYTYLLTVFPNDGSPQRTAQTFFTVN